MTKIAYIDFDDTLFFTSDAIIKAAEILMGKRLSKEEIRKLPKEVKGRVYEYAFNELRDEAKLNTSLLEILGKLKKEGFEIVILTARTKNTLDSTTYLLKKYNIPYDKLIVREDSSIADEEWKASIINNTYADHIVLFEDKLENINYIRSKIRKKNVEYFLVDGQNIQKI